MHAVGADQDQRARHQRRSAAPSSSVLRRRVEVAVVIPGTGGLPAGQIQQPPSASKAAPRTAGSAGPAGSGRPRRRRPRSSGRSTSGAMPDPATASMGQGPGCSSSSQRRAWGAVPTIGSARCLASVAHRNGVVGSVTPRRPRRPATAGGPAPVPRSPAEAEALASRAFTGGDVLLARGRARRPGCAARSAPPGWSRVAGQVRAQHRMLVVGLERVRRPGAGAAGRPARPAGVPGPTRAGSRPPDRGLASASASARAARTAAGVGAESGGVTEVDRRGAGRRDGLRVVGHRAQRLRHQLLGQRVPGPGVHADGQVGADPAERRAACRKPRGR